VFLAEAEPFFELVTLFLDVLDLIDHDLGLGLIGLNHPPFVEEI